ncbi:hypothetical protein GJ496_009171 [Pomphorhynchus laevis]|nr:hypothetical protein GJ496_009171 [Pomphorhynchus laevis]
MDQFSANSPHPSEDNRCRCICPSFSHIPNYNLTDSGRRIYISVIPLKEDCKCEKVVFNDFPDLANNSDFLKQFCPRCQCEYEIRRTSVMRIMVILVVTVMVCLHTYMICMVSLQKLCHWIEVPRSSTLTSSRQQLINTSSDSNINNIGSCSSFIFNKLEDRQNRWQQQLEGQRHTVYKNISPFI